MDKNIILRINVVLAGIILIFCIFLAGCGTISGLGAGIACTAQGIGKDSYNLWESIQKSDEWIKENLW